MFCGNRLLRILSVILAFSSAIILTGCLHLPKPANQAQINALQFALISLHSHVQTNEAAQVATLAYDYPRQLASEYRLVRPPLFHNLLINIKLKQRGLCYQWAEDLAAKLQTLRLESLEIHWGVYRAGTFREHNTVVITAWNQPFTNGIVLDPWRHSGELAWASVTHDAYAWVEGELYLPPPVERPATSAAMP